MKRVLSSVLALSLFASTLSVPAFADDAQAGKTTVTPQMTWVDYDNPAVANGYIAAGSTARTGYHKTPGTSINWGNTGWGENKIAYLKVDASTITDSNIVSAVLSLDVSGSSDNKRTCGYGVLNVAYTDWDDTLTYNSASSNGMTSGTTVGEMSWTSTKSSTTFETKTFDITDALINDADRVLTLAIYETAAAGGYIKNPTVTVEHSNSSVYTVTYDVDGTVTEESVLQGNLVAEVPSTVKTGYLFKGWSDGVTDTLYSTDELKALAISADMKFSAVFEKDPDYIEPITSMTVTGPSSMTLGPDPDTAVANTYSINLTGELGTDIDANPDSRVTDYNVEWEFLGYKTENDTEGQYCDSYASVSYNGTPATSADFNLKNVSFNFYGKIKATVTYNGQTIEASTYALILGDATSDSNVILPTAGYPSDVSTYSDELVGYSCVDETYGNSTDAILGNFCVAGSDGVKSLVLMEENGEKFLRMTKGTAKKSGVATHKISSPATQIITEQDVRFNSTGGVITMTAGYPFWSSNSSYGEAITLSFNGSALTLNGTALKNGENDVTVNSGTWYKVVLSVDKTTETAYAQLYDKTGETLIGEIYDVPWAASCTPTYYSYGVGNSYTGTMDFNNYKMYYPTVDEGTFAITTESETLSIPASESTTLVATVKSTDGYNISGAAEWKITDESMAEGVTITPDATNSHKAVVSVSTTAVPGTLPVQVTIGGISKTIELTLTSSADSVKFTKSATSVSIPLEEGATESVQFEAIIIDKDAQKVNDCTYAIYDKSNNTELTALPAGITFDAITGTLTVAAGALPGTFSIRATGNNSSGESISKAVKVTVHGLSFDFGAGTDETIAEGYTSVSPDTAYTEKLGFGITGTAVAGGTGSTTDANADYLEGTFKFNAKVAKGNVYKVTVQFAGNMVSEYVDSVLSGHTRTLDAENTTYTGYTVATTEIAEHVYTIPVVDDVLDLSFTNAKVASISVEKVDRVAGDKPHIYSVGDSTLGNNGSYGYVLARDQANYPELSAIATYYNNGKGSRTLSTYYTQGWLDGVLASVKPGDIVTIGNMGTNTGGLSGSAFKAPLDYYTDAALAMGAKVILTSYTPHGAVSSWSNLYDSTTQTFTAYRTDSYDSEGIRVIYEERKNEEGILGFIDIGKNADAAFNAYVDDYAANGYASRDAAAQAIIACFPDHNHYNGLACQLMLEGYGDVPGIVSELVRLIGGNTDEPEPTPTVPPTEETPTPPPTVPDPTPTVKPEEPTPTPTVPPVEETPTPTPTVPPVEETPTPTPTVEPTEEPSDRPEVVGDNLITNGNFANGTADWTNAADGGAYSGTLTAEAPYVHGDGQALTNTVSAGGSATTTLRRFIPVEAGKTYYMSFYVYNTGAAVTGTAFMSAFVPVTGTAFGSFNGVTFKDYAEYGGQNSWSAEPQSEVNRSRDDMDYDAGMNHKEFTFTIPEGADNILISMFAWTDPGRLYVSDFELYEVAEPPVMVYEAKANVESGVVPYGTVVTISSGAHVAIKDDNGEWVYEYMPITLTITEDTTITVKAWVDNIEEGVTYECPEVTYTYTVDPATIPTPPPAEGVYNVTFENLDPVIVASDVGMTEILTEPYTTTNGTIYFLVPLRDGGGDLTLTASNGTIEYIGVGEADGLGGDIYKLSGVSEDATVVADWYGGPFLSITAERTATETVQTKVAAGMANASAPFGTVIVAAYAEDGRLLSVQSIPCPGGHETLDWNITGKATFKAMWWTSLADMEPVIEAETAVIE